MANYALGYLDKISRITTGNFDGVFCNVAWYYCMSDFAFANELLGVVRPGGTVFVRQTTEHAEERPSLGRRVAYLANRTLAIKIGHTYPPAGRIAKAFIRAGNCRVSAMTLDGHVEIVSVTKER
jgi:hypothetical protein